MNEDERQRLGYNEGEKATLQDPDMMKTETAISDTELVVMGKQRTSKRLPKGRNMRLLFANY